MIEPFFDMSSALAQFMKDFEALEMGFRVLPGTHDEVRLQHIAIGGPMVPCFCPITAVCFAQTKLHFSVTQADTAGLKIGLEAQDISYIIAAADKKHPELICPTQATLLLHLRKRMLDKLQQLTPKGDPQ